MKIIIIFFLSFSSLICGQWTQIADVTTGENEMSYYDNSYIVGINSTNIIVVGNRSSTRPWIFRSKDSSNLFEQIFLDYLKTNDKGKVIHTPSRMINFKLMDSLHSIAMCENFNYWRTEDGGKNWINGRIANGGNNYLRVDAYKNRLAIANNLGNGVNIIYTSFDFGKNWDSVNAIVNYNFNLKVGNLFLDKLKVINATTMVADGIYLVDIYHKDNVYFHTISTDFGKNWEITEYKNRNSHFNYIGLSNNRIYAVGSVQVEPYSSDYRDLFKLSTDGGYSWTTIKDTVARPTTPLGGVEFIDEKRGIAFSRDFAKLYRTSDGGMTWYRDFGPEEFQYPPHDYDYLPNGEILAVASTGKVYRWSDPSLSIEDPEDNQVKGKVFKIFPNPVPQNQSLNIVFNPTFMGNATVSIVDMRGKALTTFGAYWSKFEEYLTFQPDNDLPTGTYFIQIEYENGIAERQMFVVE